MTTFIDSRILDIQTRYAHFATDFVLLRVTDETLKIVLEFEDGTTLRITERWRDEELIRYSYYWLDGETQLKVGWDNAPHHPTVSSFPHHRHMGPDGEPIPSTEQTLDDVITHIKQAFD